MQICTFFVLCRSYGNLEGHTMGHRLNTHGPLGSKRWPMVAKKAKYLCDKNNIFDDLLLLPKKQDWKGCSVSKAAQFVLIYSLKNGLILSFLQFTAICNQNSELNTSIQIFSPKSFCAGSRPITVTSWHIL